uniref:Uncharacterized protein n=1 Tax=Knipowitschia caucasica TaxID=637954 RepID=A0AAV2J5R4_KNICA
MDSAVGGTASNSSPLSLLIDTSYSSEEQRSLVDTSTLPSPEVFREERYADLCPFSLDDDLVLPIKNSTLMETSRSEAIHLYHHPELSSITDSPTVLEEKPLNLCTNQRPPSDDRSPLFSERREEAEPRGAKEEEQQGDQQGGVFFDFPSDHDLQTNQKIALAGVSGQIGNRAVTNVSYDSGSPWGQIHGIVSSRVRCEAVWPKLDLSPGFISPHYAAHVIPQTF